MPTRLYIMISKRLEETREARGYSRAELGALVGVSAATIGYYERGERCPDLEKFTAICRVLDISSDYLLEITDTKQPQTPPPDLDPDRIKQASYLATIIYRLTERDQLADYDRDCLPVYQEILEALLELIQSTDEIYAELKEKYPAFTGTTPGSIPYEQRLAYIAQNMTGTPSNVAKDWVNAYTDFTNKINTHVSATANRIHFLIALDLLGPLTGNNGRNVPPVVPTK